MAAFGSHSGRINLDEYIIIGIMRIAAFGIERPPDNSNRYAAERAGGEIVKKLDLGQSIQIVANLGVIAGIIFLAVEISQNQASLEEQNTLTRLSGRDVALDYFSDWRTLLLENPELLDVWQQGNAGDSLTSSEANRYEFLCIEHLYMGVTLYNRFNALGLTEEKEALLSYMADQLSASEVSLSCWETMKGSVAARGYADFADFVDRLIPESR